MGPRDTRYMAAAYIHQRLATGGMSLDENVTSNETDPALAFSASEPYVLNLRTVRIRLELFQPVVSVADHRRGP